MNAIKRQASFVLYNSFIQPYLLQIYQKYHFFVFTIQLNSLAQQCCRQHIVLYQLSLANFRKKSNFVVVVVIWFSCVVYTNSAYFCYCLHHCYFLSHSIYVRVCACAGLEYFIVKCGMKNKRRICWSICIKRRGIIFLVA